MASQLGSLSSVYGGDVALIDISLPDKKVADLITAFRQIQSGSENPDLKICLLLDPEQEIAWQEALALNVEGYCLKTAPPEQLSTLVRSLHSGHPYWDPNVVACPITT